VTDGIVPTCDIRRSDRVDDSGYPAADQIRKFDLCSALGQSRSQMLVGAPTWTGS